jgi:hypothetical protein
MSNFLCCFRRGETALFSTLPQQAKKEKEQIWIAGLSAKT